MINAPFVINLAAFWVIYNCVIWALKHNPIGRRILGRLEFYGFQFEWFQIKWYTTKFNRPLARLVTRFRPILWKRWFALGAFFTCIITLVSVLTLCILLFNSLAQQFFPKKGEILSEIVQTSSHSQNNVGNNRNALVPLVPGVNLPTSQVVYVLIALFICTVFHEIGHAIAALADQVRLNGCGVFVFLVYPGAYVDLPSDNLQDLPPLYQLRIYCAGVWHNLAMCLGAIFLLITLPATIWSLVFNIDTGVIVTAVSSNSPLSGPRGLALGDELTAVGNCSVQNSTAWRFCISKALAEPQLGNCMLPSSTEQITDEDCCISNNSSRTNACFYHNSYNNNAKNDDKMKTEVFETSYSCLPAHMVVNHLPFCLSNADCKPSRLLAVLNVEAEAKQERPVCVFPKVDKLTRLLPVFRRNHVPLLFYGYPSDLLYFSTVSDYIPITSIMPASVPIVVDTLLRYVLSLSAALVLFNAVPCYGLDGQYILGALVEHFLSNYKNNQPKRPHPLLYNAMLAFGTLLLLANVVLAFSNLF